MKGDPKKHNFMDDVLKITHRFGETFDVPRASVYLFRRVFAFYCVLGSLRYNVMVQFIDSEDIRLTVM